MNNILQNSSMDDYPYKRRNPNYGTQVMNMFENLKKLKPVVKSHSFRIRNITDLPESMLLYNGDSRVVIVPKNSYDAYDNISDYFQEHQRVRCSRFDQTMSSHEYWNKNKDSIKDEASITREDPREILYSRHYECTAFKPSLAVSFSYIFPAGRVLDISSGWGDRLVGFMASSETEYYLGADPNLALQPGYDDMVNTFGADPEKYRVIASKFQDLDISGEDEFDLVFTSPPYFNLENYGNGDEQSHIEFPNVSDWLHGFLIPCMRKAFNKLKIGGHIIININEMPSTSTGLQNSRNQSKYISNMLYEMSKTPGCIYIGCIAQQQEFTKKSPQPFWVWRKSDCPELNPDNELNPPIKIANISNSNKTLRVIRDDLLLGGTKQRGIIDLFSQITENTVVYAGPNTQFAQIVVALGARLTGKKCIIFTSRSRPLSNMTRIAIRMGAIIYEGKTREKFHDLRSRAADYVQKNPGCFEINFDFTNDLFRDSLVNSLKTAIDDTLDMGANHIFWVVAGSAVMLRILYQIFPNSWFNVVQIGKEIDWFVDFDRSRLFVAPEWFFDEARDLPPYPSVRDYDAKLWQFVREHGKSGDIIWNIARDPELIDMSCIDKFEYSPDDGWTHVYNKKRSGNGRGRGRRRGRGY